MDNKATVKISYGTNDEGDPEECVDVKIHYNVPTGVSREATLERLLSDLEHQFKAAFRAEVMSAASHVEEAEHWSQMGL